MACGVLDLLDLILHTWPKNLYALLSPQRLLSLHSFELFSGIVRAKLEQINDNVSVFQ
jgi:hypothetical protein